MPFIGCHISTTGGVENSPYRGRELGCDAMQIFTSNQMQWKSRPISDSSRENFLEGLRSNNIKQVVSHDSYLINLGSPDFDKLEKSRKAFAEEMDRSEFLQIPYVVFHPGSHLGKGEDYCLKTIAESINLVTESKNSYNLMLLLEITAGQGSNVGYRFEHLRTIIDRCDYPQKIGVCYDTCHAYAAGYDIVSEEAYEKTLKEFDEIIGLDRLKVFHLNDSKRELGSKRDRHECLGKGYIGWEPFFRITNDERFANLSMVLETPGGDENYAKEIAKLKANLKK